MSSPPPQVARGHLNARRRPARVPLRRVCTGDINARLAALFAANQPITVLINAVRSLMLGGTDAAGVGHTTSYWVLLSLLWCAGILALFSVSRSPASPAAADSGMFVAASRRPGRKERR
jgi:hypothetical protein